MRIGEKAHPADVNPDRRPGHERRRGRLQLGQPLVGPFAHELGGDVQVGGRAPMDARRGPQPVHQRFQAANRFGRQVEAEE